MNDGVPSLTAQRVAVYRLGFERLEAPFGDASADERLALDVAGSSTFEPHGNMTRYLQGRTSFFDRVVLRALDRDVAQVVVVGAGYDGRSLRYAKPGVRWWEVDHPDTQADKRSRLERLGIDDRHVLSVGHDLGNAGLAAALIGSGYEPDALSLILCEGVAVYLDQPVLETLLHELRALATVGTRLALSVAVALPPEDRGRRERFASAVAAVGEPVRNAVTSDDIGPFLSTARWRAVDVSERARHAGYVVAAPTWEPVTATTPTTAIKPTTATEPTTAITPTTAAEPTTATQPAPPATASRIGRYLERTLYRSGTDTLPAHLERRYGIDVARLRELDVGVFRIDRRDGRSWVARVFPATRPIEAVEGDAGILRALQGCGFPAERGADPDPVSVHEGQGVLVTEHVAGHTPKSNQQTFHALGDLLGRLHSLATAEGAMARPGGAWHHLGCEGDARQEIAAMLALLDDATPRVPLSQRAGYRALRDELRRSDDGTGLPHAPVHPDLVPVNVVAPPEGEMVVIDWAGAGRGPRLPSFGFLLWAAGARDLRCVDAVVTGYRPHVLLQPDELDRLPAVIAARPVLFDCWAFVTGRQPLPAVMDSVATDRRRATAVAARARTALTT